MGKSKHRLPNRRYEKLGLDGVINGYASAENETETFRGTCGWVVLGRAKQNRRA